MRPLFHPPADSITPEAVLHALADTERAAIFAHIAGAGTAEACRAHMQQGDRVIPKSSLSQHIRILREAGLIRSERQGVEMLNHSRLAELEAPIRALATATLDAYRWYYGKKMAANRAETAKVA
jgi:DNA-binding transcriptional ArsR family regulator